MGCRRYLLQKNYMKDFISHKQVKNDGRFPRYYVEDAHGGILRREYLGQTTVNVEDGFGEKEIMLHGQTGDAMKEEKLERRADAENTSEIDKLQEGIDSVDKQEKVIRDTISMQRPERSAQPVWMKVKLEELDRYLY